MPPEYLKSLSQYAEDKHNDELIAGNTDIDDLKISLTRDQLLTMIGSSNVQELERLFGDSYNEILIRICQSHGKLINFHIDHSLKTMQVALNGDDDYEGGRLVYATKDGL